MEPGVTVVEGLPGDGAAARPRRDTKRRMHSYTVAAYFAGGGVTIRAATTRPTEPGPELSRNATAPDTLGWSSGRGGKVGKSPAVDWQVEPEQTPEAHRRFATSKVGKDACTGERLRVANTGAAASALAGGTEGTVLPPAVRRACLLPNSPTAT